MTNAELRRWTDALVEAFHSASPEGRDVILDQAELLRDELLRRQWRPGDPGSGVREPRGPLPDPGSTGALPDSDD